MEKKRDHLKIIYDILFFIGEKRREVKPTHILYKSNLSHIMLTEYLNELIEKELIKEMRDKKDKKTYILTEKGYKFLKDFDVIKKFMDSYGLDF